MEKKRRYNSTRYFKRHFCNALNIRKNQELAYIFIINHKSCDRLVTTYDIYNV